MASLRLPVFVILLFSGSSALAQGACDSVYIDRLVFDALIDNTVELTISNESSRTFMDPRFVLRNEVTDELIAEEIPELDSIGASSQHTLVLNPDVNAEPVFNGQLLLYNIFDTLPQCVFTPAVELCKRECSNVTLEMFGFGSVTAGTLQWEIRKASNNRLEASGQLSYFGPGSTETADTYCLLPGSYNIRFYDNDGVFGALEVEVTTDWYTERTIFDVYQSPELTFEFDFLTQCEPAVGITNIQRKASKLRAYTVGEVLHVTTDERNLGQLNLYSIDGVLIDQPSFNSNSGTLSMDGFSSGIYIIGSPSEGFVKFVR